ncbi:unnamed protein product [Candidula unifasciata]|uniref:peptidylprolyl isomerase n=1 Tax=Candidula unifasciata TaxID=100452 RepID=A0A8S3ZHA2_9EUPU|nr:unnamed protein product [Candidula unifasciata]
MGVDVEHIEEGDGKTYPKAGDKVVVHYLGTLTNGKKFDSSYDRNKPFTFTIGKGQVIKGWDEGIPKISKGGKAKIVVSPDCAYGKKGVPGTYPLLLLVHIIFNYVTIGPNETLVFEVHLVDINPA